MPAPLFFNNMSRELGIQLVRKNKLEKESKELLRKLEIVKIREIAKFLSDKQEARK